MPTRGARAIAVHPRFVRRALDRSDNREAPADDVALVLLDAPVTDVTPLALRASAPPRGRRGLLLGSGQKRVPRANAAANYERLRKATLTVISDGACSAFYRRRGGAGLRSALRPRSMLCATDPDGRVPFRSACTGDSGGPLVVGSTLAGHRELGPALWRRPRPDRVHRSRRPSRVPERARAGRRAGQLR